MLNTGRSSVRATSGTSVLPYLSREAYDARRHGGYSFLPRRCFEGGARPVGVGDGAIDPAEIAQAAV
eukprot:7951713-Lingulodinium_polyedra.AAC.1